MATRSDPTRHLTRSGYWLIVTPGELLPGTVRITIADDEDPTRHLGASLTASEAIVLAARLTEAADIAADRLDNGAEELHRYAEAQRERELYERGAF